MNKALIKTNYHFPGQVGVYNGKVRDVYNIEGKTLVMVATDRISAFDVILPEGIPYKGQVLNQIASKFLDATADICPNWKLATPDPLCCVSGQYVRRSLAAAGAGNSNEKFLPASAPAKGQGRRQAPHDTERRSGRRR